MIILGLPVGGWHGNRCSREAGGKMYKKFNPPRDDTRAHTHTRGQTANKNRYPLLGSRRWGVRTTNLDRKMGSWRADGPLIEGKNKKGENSVTQV